MAKEFGTLRNREGNLRKEETEDMTLWSDYVNGIDYEGHQVNPVGIWRKKEILVPH